MTTTAPPTAPPDDSAGAASSPRMPFLPPMPAPRWAGWAAAVALAVFAGVLRFFRLGAPERIYFDETYYVKDAFGLRTFGYEHDSVDNADQLIQSGDLNIWTGVGDFIVHPPVGKWMIAGGDLLWGLLPWGTSMTPEGWRFASALFGALTVLVLVRVALRMTRSWVLAAAAGLLLALDGLHFTMSRIAMLDVFMTFWIVAAFACLLADRDRIRARLRLDPAAAWLGVRWWRYAAGACLGLAVGTKWTALFFVAVFGILTVAWDLGARRSAGQGGAGPDGTAGRSLGAVLTGRSAAGRSRTPGELAVGVRTAALVLLLAAAAAGITVFAWTDLGTGPGAFAAIMLLSLLAAAGVLVYRAFLARVWLLFDAVPAFLQTVGVAALVYVASWTGWLATSGGYARQWAADHAPAPGWVPGPLTGLADGLRSLVYYHVEMWKFHQGLSEPHDYASQPWEWIIQRTPVAFYYDGETTGCGASRCSEAILSVGTPVIWWIGIIALVAMAGWWLIYRDWRAGAVLLAIAAGWLPLFAYPDRTMFVFYALPFLPFLVLAIVLMLGLAMGDGESGRNYLPGRRIVGGIAFGVVLLLSIANFAFLYPVLSAENIPYDAWHQRMWFDTWIFGSGGGSGN
ncbi:dolichyl-phosphate-mannose--protein mannosyltransferase [Nocardiopsis coralliicola]